MNCLNSLILGGTVASVMEDGVFLLSTSRYYKDGEELKEEKSVFSVAVYGKLAEFSKDKLILNRGVRIVGRLKQDKWTDSEGNEFSKVIVVAEHIEYKPMLKKEVKAEDTEVTF